MSQKKTKPKQKAIDPSKTRAVQPANTRKAWPSLWSPVLLVMEDFRNDLGDRWNTVRKTVVEGPMERATWRVCSTLQSVKKWTLDRVDARIDQLHNHRDERKLQADEVSRFDDEGGAQQPVSASLNSKKSSPRNTIQTHA